MKVIDKVALDSVVKRLVARLRPTRVYLYGSHASGTPHAGSDVDILVVVPASDLPPHKRDSIAYACVQGSGIPIELQVYTSEELDRRASVPTSFERSIIDHGRVLYDADT